MFSESDIKFHGPFTMVIAGSSSSGKTTWLLKFLEKYRVLVDPPPLDVLYCYATYHDKMTRIKELGASIYEGIPSQEVLDSLRKPSLVIFDDLMEEMSEKNLVDLFVKKSHHENMSIIYIVQDLFHKTLRIPRTNAHYLVLTKAPNALLKIRTLGSQIFPNQLKFFMDAYKKATSKNYGSLIVDLHPSSDSKLRLRSDIFGEHPKIYLPINESF